MCQVFELIERAGRAQASRQSKHRSCNHAVACVSEVMRLHTVSGPVLLACQQGAREGRVRQMALQVLSVLGLGELGSYFYVFLVLYHYCGRAARFCGV